MNDYGISKLDGEKVVLEQNPDNVVLRIPILYGDVEYLDESAITTLFPKLKVARNPAKMGRRNWVGRKGICPAPAQFFTNKNTTDTT